jgi:hypothetical protein
MSRYIIPQEMLQCPTPQSQTVPQICLFSRYQSITDTIKVAYNVIFGPTASVACGIGCRHF